MMDALAMAGLQSSDIDYVNAHGTGTPNNDESEGHAMMRVFGDTMPPVSSTKSYTGHTTSASGGVEAVISILALIRNFIMFSPIPLVLEGMALLVSSQKSANYEYLYPVSVAYFHPEASFGGMDGCADYS